MVVNVFEVEPNKNWKLNSCKGLELTYNTAKRTETDVQNWPSWAAILASLFARANNWELAFQIWKLSSLGHHRSQYLRSELEGETMTMSRMFPITTFWVIFSIQNKYRLSHSIWIPFSLLKPKLLDAEKGELSKKGLEGRFLINICNKLTSLTVFLINSLRPVRSKSGNRSYT